MFHADIMFATDPVGLDGAKFDARASFVTRPESALVLKRWHVVQVEVRLGDSAESIA